MPDPSIRDYVPTGEELNEQIDATTKALLPFYNDKGEDSANSVQSRNPDSGQVIAALGGLIDIMLPGRLTSHTAGPDDFGVFLRSRVSDAMLCLRPEIERVLPLRWKGQAARAEGLTEHCNPYCESIRLIRKFLGTLPEIRRKIITDIQAAYNGDPAALTFAEVHLTYPGLLAITSHRVAHALHRLNIPVIPRVMSEWTHSKTGADIHPGATIGEGFFIDHATGVVLGETCVIGNHVKLYQGVTLGARSFPLDEHGNPIKHIKRHPTVEDDVVVYANATILGGKTVVGRGAVIGANVFIMESVEPNHIVGVKQPELIRKQKRS